MTPTATRSITQLTGQLAHKRVLVRVDFNVPTDADGQITDDTRIQMALDTIRFLQREQARIILISHRGRPNGQVVERDRFTVVANQLSRLLGDPVIYVAAGIQDADTQSVLADLADGEVMLLENCRFDPRETTNDPDFAKELASIADVYVMDAFGTAHRAHASTVGVAAYLPSYTGCLMDNELSALSAVVSGDKRPVVAIIGGAKISTKIGVLEHLLGTVDVLIVGGGMVFTLLSADGCEIGKSLFEADKLDVAISFLQKARTSSTRLILATDFVCAPEFSESVDCIIVDKMSIPKSHMGLDIGPETVKQICQEIDHASVIVWNGPMGVFEMPTYAAGTLAVAQAVANSDAFSVVGGGDSVAAINQANLGSHISHISTGGGACLELLEGRVLPAVAAIQQSPLLS